MSGRRLADHRHVRTDERRLFGISSDDHQYRHEDRHPGILRPVAEKPGQGSEHTTPVLMTAGKTLLLNTVDRFLSNQYEDQARLFEGLAIWEEEKFRKLQGSLPVIFLSFADVKQASYDGAVEQFRRLINELYQQFSFLTDSVEITEGEKQRFESYASYFAEMTEGEIAGSLRFLASLLYQHYGQKVIILLDEYDTPIGKHKPHMGNEVLCR